MKCPGCGLGWSAECDNPGNSNFPYCACGGVHDHDSMIKTKCIPLYWPDGKLVTA